MKKIGIINTIPISFIYLLLQANMIGITERPIE